MKFSSSILMTLASICLVMSAISETVPEQRYFLESKPSSLYRNSPFFSMNEEDGTLAVNPQPGYPVPLFLLNPRVHTNKRNSEILNTLLGSQGLGALRNAGR
ncbi:UNVERIFIED_CONTAM: hypothetical protein RMT77_000700 [Armadillidium vulgare]